MEHDILTEPSTSYADETKKRGHLLRITCGHEYEFNENEQVQVELFLKSTGIIPEKKSEEDEDDDDLKLSNFDIESNLDDELDNMDLKSNEEVKSNAIKEEIGDYSLLVVPPPGI